MSTAVVIVKLITAVLGSVGFAILFYLQPQKLPLAAAGGLLTCGVYLGVQVLLGGELVPNLAATFVGAIFSEILARLTKAPVPVYLLPCLIPLVPGGMLYKTMNHFIQGSYGAAGSCGLTALAVAVGIAGGIMAASVCSMLYGQAAGYIKKKHKLKDFHK